MADRPGTRTQPRPNISTENSEVGTDTDPKDTLDRDRPAPKERVARRSALTKAD
ncbi:hypothetical protein [Sphingomonas sp. DT-204]|uniref:hypothetical protein n=1 Tax=Sphingomonas sp. DT-204 TaxID=3396166 RepID=UPI003F1A24A0